LIILSACRRKSDEGLLNQQWVLAAHLGRAIGQSGKKDADSAVLQLGPIADLTSSDHHHLRWAECRSKRSLFSLMLRLPMIDATNMIDTDH
jgi:hypothetical protein